MNIEDALFDFNQINAFVPWLILVNVLYWAFIYVTWTLHVLHLVREFMGLVLDVHQNNLLNSVQPSELILTFWILTEFISFNVLWSLDPWFDLYFVCVLVNHSRRHKYQELSKSINPLITIDVFNDFLIQSQNHFLHKICSCHIYSCMFFVWRLLRDRVPTKDNLFHYRIISVGDQMCVSGCGQSELASHQFLDCSFFGAL